MIEFEPVGPIGKSAALKLWSASVYGSKVSFTAALIRSSPHISRSFPKLWTATRPAPPCLGSLGYCLELALRPGVQHSALETELNMERVLPMAAKLTPLPLLFRADSGLCSLKIMQEVSTQAAALSREIAFIIKWNPRSTPVEAIAAQRVLDANTTWCHLREGKRMCLWTQALKLEGVGTEAKPARRVLRLVERTIDKHGNPLLLPAYELEGWTTTLADKFTMQDVIDLYKDHATHEQFHSEFKTDMDLERLPSGKFDTNFLIGQNALIGKDAPLRHAAKRRRMKTVMQEIMFKAGRMIKHAGRWVLGLGANDSAHTVFERLYRQLTPAHKTSTA